MKRAIFFGFNDFVCSGVSAGFMSLIVRVVPGSTRWFASAGEQVQVRKSIPVSSPRRLRVGFLERIASASSILNRSSSFSVAERILKRSLGLDFKFLCAFLLIPKTLGNRKERLCVWLRSADKHHPRKSSDRKAQISPVSGTNAS